MHGQPGFTLMQYSDLGKNSKRINFLKKNMGVESEEGHYAVGMPLDQEYGTVKARVLVNLIEDNDLTHNMETMQTQTGDQPDEIFRSLQELAETELVNETDEGYTVNENSAMYHALNHISYVRLGQQLQDRGYDFDMSEELEEAADSLAEYVDRRLDIT